jgi:hypothetical protein
MNASEIIRPIVGLGSGQFIPLSENIRLLFLWLFLPIQTLTIFAWIIIIVAIIKYRHYEDSNNLLIISFSLADLIFTITMGHSAASLVWNHGYANGYAG